jgi:hypothetical protein
MNSCPPRGRPVTVTVHCLQFIRSTYRTLNNLTVSRFFSPCAPAEIAYLLVNGPNMYGMNGTDPRMDGVTNTLHEIDRPSTDSQLSTRLLSNLEHCQESRTKLELLNEERVEGY